MKSIAIWLAIVAFLSGVSSSETFAAPPSHFPGGMLIQVKPPRVAHIKGRPKLLSTGIVMRQAANKPVPRPKKAARSSRLVSRALLALPGAQTVGCAAGSSQPAPIVALASALKCDPDLIYEYVYNNIEYEPLYGSNKGPLGTLLDGRGDDADQTILLVTLLNAAGYSQTGYYAAGFCYTAAQLSNWLGVANDATAMEGLLNNGGIVWETAATAGCPAGNLLAILHFIAGVQLSGTWYYFDPSYKPHTITTGLANLGTVLGYNRSQFLTAVGGSTSSYSISSLSRSNLRSQITTYATNLVNYINQNNRTWAVGNIIGGKTITPLTGSPIRVTYSGATPTTSFPADCPDQTPTLECRTYIIITMAGASSGQSIKLYTDQVYGHRITVFSVPSGGNYVPTLLVDGVAPACVGLGTCVNTGTPTAPGGATSVAIQIAQPNQGTGPSCSSGIAVCQNLTFAAGGSYLISLGVGQVSRGMAEYHRQLLNQARAAGNADNSEPVLGENLAVISYNWLAEKSNIQQLLDPIIQTKTQYKFSSGITGQTAIQGSGSQGPYVDLPVNSEGLNVQNSGDGTLTIGGYSFQIAFVSAAFAQSEVSSSLEAAVLQQTQAPVSGMTAASTMKVIDANMNPSYSGNTGVTFYADGTTSSGLNNYFTNIRPNLTSTYSPSGLSNIDYLISTNGTSSGSPAGSQVLIPEQGSLSVGVWSGAGNTDILPSSGGLIIAQAITGGMSGGFSGVNITDPAVNTVVTLNPPANASSVTSIINQISAPTNSKSGEPVDTIAGAYLYTHNDLVTGGGQFPYTLAFSRSYSSASGSYLTTTSADSGSGNGWSNGYAISAQIQSDPYIGMGSSDTSATSAANSIAAAYVLQDLLSITPTPQTMTVSSMVAQWLTDQITGNVAMVTQPNTTEEYVALPHLDGATSVTFNPPPGSSIRFSQTATGTFQYLQKDGVALSFGSTPAGALQGWTYPNGMTVSLTYSGSQLQKVTNNLGRSLSLSYSGTDISTVSDDTGRSVSYSYDTHHDLIGYTDPLGAFTGYSYDTSGSYDTLGHLTQIFYPSNPRNAFVTNYYDPLSRVIQQANANGNSWNFYLAGSRSEIVDAIGDRHVTYQTDRGRVIKDAFVLSGTADVFNDTAQHNGVVNVTKNQYDGIDRLVTTTAPEADYITYAYDGITNPWANNIVLITLHPKPGSPLSPIVQTFTYDPNWNKAISATDGRSLATKNSYDPLTGNLLTTTADSGIGHFNASNSYGYNSIGQVITATDPLGTITEYVYDPLGNQTSITRDFGTGHLNQVTSMSYNALGDVITITDPNRNVTTSAYDQDRRITNLVQPSNPTLTTAFFYDPDGHLLQTQQSASGSVLRITSSTYSLTGEVSTTTDANGNTTRLAYDADDRLSSITDPVNNATTFTYDAMSRQTQIHNLKIESAPLLQKAYSPDGVLSSLTDANSHATTYAYDGVNRLSTSTYLGGTTETFTYDADSNMLTRKTRKGDTITFTYDTLNRAATKAAPSEPSVTYAYDLNGHLIAANDNSAAITAPSGTSASYATSYTYDALNRSLTASWTPAPAQATPTASGTTFTHGYDGNNRRLNQNANDNSWLSYPTTATAISYTPNTLNQYSAVGTVTPTYDGNGNLTYDGTFTYCYDAESRMTGIISAGTCASPTTTVATYAYNAQGRRKSKTIGSTTTLFTADADNREVLEYNGSGATQNWYAYGQGSNEVLNQMNVASSKRQTLVPDIQGSVIGTLDSSTGTLAKIGYQAYGENPALSSGSFNYTAQRFDAETAGSAAQPSGLYYYRARMYSPAWGRFLQTDPIGYASGANLYAYTRNDPLNLIDPTGLAPGDSYPTANEAAIAAMHDIYSISVQQNVEYAGRIYQNWFGLGSYSYTAPNRGTVARSSPGGVPLLTTGDGYYHSHGGPDPQYDSENFSTQDINFSNGLGQPGYVVTPSGIYQEYDPATQQITTLLQTNPPGTPIPDAPNYPTAQAPNSSAPLQRSSQSEGSAGNESK